MTDLTTASSERCVLCLDQKRSPVRIQCGHSFCYGCLDVYKSYKKYPWANKCPICRDVLKEKRTTKRKYSEMSGAQDNVSIMNNSNRTLTLNPTMPPEQICILEEFMALASDYDNNNNEDQGDIIDLDEYESIHDLTGDDEGDYNYDESTDFENDSYDEELDFYTDTDDDDGENYYYFEETEDGTIRSSTDFESFPEMSSSESVRNCNNSDIDWETVIGSDVIIID